MKKILSVFLGFLLCMSQASPIQAQETEVSLDEVFTAATDVTDVFRNAGFDTEQLLTLMAIMPKDNSAVTLSNYESDLDLYFRENPIPLFNPADYDLPEGSLYAGDYSGNPPASDVEQQQRMSYLSGVLSREYSDSKYNKGTYMSYLYASHYLENATYDPTHTDAQNFDGIYAHIIGNEDIRNFDNFYNIGRNAAIASSFKSMGSLAASLADNVKKETAKLILAEYRERVDNDMTEFMRMLNELGIVGESEIMDTIKNFNNALIIAVNEDSTATTEALIESVYSQLSTNFPHKVCSYYVSTLNTLTGSVALVSLVSPVLAGVIFYAETLCNLITTASLGALYYTWHGRKTERQLIAYGMRPRP